jgi:cobalt-zinc-cadmium efflux system outer membrane protein
MKTLISKIFCFLTVTLLSACASHGRESLSETSDAALHGESIEALFQAATKLKHPRLQAVELTAGRPLSLEAVGVLSVVGNPDLKAARQAAKVADAQVLAAGLLPDPTINLSTDIRQSGPDKGNGWATQLSYDLAAIRDRGVAMRSAKAAQRQARYDLAWREWTTAEQARLAAAKTISLSETTVLAEISAHEAERLLSLSLAAQAKGDLKADDVQTRRLASLDAAAALAQTRKDLAAARLDLDNQLGLRPDTALDLASLDPVVERALSYRLDAEALFEAARRQRLDLLALEAGYASQNAQVRKAAMDAFPSFQLTVNRATDTAGNVTLGPAVNFSLPIWNRNRGGVAIAEATRDQLRAEYAARVFATRAEIVALCDNLALARRLWLETDAQVRALESQAAAATEAGRRGDISASAAEAVQQVLRDRLAARAAIRQSLAEQMISLELATGAPLAPNS